MDSYHYPYAPVERTMKIQEVILRPMDGWIKGYQGDEILGISDPLPHRSKGPWGSWASS